MELDEHRIAAIVAEVVRDLRAAGAISPPDRGAGGIFADVGSALAAAAKTQAQLAAMPRERREKLIEAIRDAGVRHAEFLAHKAVEATGFGRVEDKIRKNINAARLSPGTEDLAPGLRADDRGLLVEEYAPFGVIVSITPATHPASQLINHAIIFTTGGNTAFIAPHPRAQAASLAAIRIINEAVAAAGGPAPILTAVAEGTMETVRAAMQNQLTALVTAAGGPGVVQAALASGKKAIVAGPGNPPVVVDETADLQAAAKHITAGSWFDNNLLCIAEKSVFVVETAANAFFAALAREGAQVLDAAGAAAVTRLVVKDGRANPEYIGKDAGIILEAAGIAPQAGVRGIVMDVGEDHPLVQIEQLMPVLPVVRVPGFTAAVEAAVRTEHGFGHTSLIHSRDAERINHYGRRLATTILVANAPSGAALGVGGPGVFGHTIASPLTGEGVCTPRSFCRRRLKADAAGRFV